MTSMQPVPIEISAEEMAKLRRIVDAPEDLEQLIEIAEVSRGEFLSFMDSAGLWDDPEYAHIAGQVLSILEQRSDGKPKDTNVAGAEISDPQLTQARANKLNRLAATAGMDDGSANNVDVVQKRDARSTDYRDPITLIDDSIENLTYLTDWLLEDIDVSALESESHARDAVRAIAALRAIRALLPRLRIVRSNFESWPSLPQAAQQPSSSVMQHYFDNSRARLLRLLDLGSAARAPGHGNSQRQSSEGRDDLEHSKSDEISSSETDELDDATLPTKYAKRHRPSTDWIGKWRKTIRSWLRNREYVPSSNIDDLTQEVLSRFQIHSDDFFVDTPQGDDVLKVATSVANEWRERAVFIKAHEHGWYGGVRIELGDAHEGGPIPRTIEEAHASLDRLPTGQQGVWVMYMNGLTVEEISQQLGLSHRTVTRLLTLARNALREQLSRAASSFGDDALRQGIESEADYPRSNTSNNTT